MLPIILAGLLMASPGVLAQTDGTCATSAGQFGQQLTTCRRGALVCTTEAHGGDAYREYYARTSCGQLGAPPTPTADAVLREQQAGPPIPGRGGPRWEGDDGR